MGDAERDAKQLDDALEEAGRIVGVLAAPERLRVFAAILMGAASPAEIASSVGLDTRVVGRALARLTEVGLITLDGDAYRATPENLGALARDLGDRIEDDVPDAPPEVASVVRKFMRKGRLVSIPTTRSKRRVILDFLAQRFDPGVRYQEKEVNAILREYHDDVASLRRYLVDERFLERASGEYWRAGGTFEI